MRVALASGVSIGIFLAALGQTGPSAGLWPLGISRLLSTIVFTSVAGDRPGPPAC
ncbi:MAG: hypothetical protein R2712_04365 [Vicinamibacterales bacterium]